MKLIEKLLSSFDNHSLGFSGRKLSGFVGVVTAVCVTFIWMRPEYLLSVIKIWLGFASVCLGIITVEQIIKLIWGKKDEPPSVT